jgi:phosphoribosylcarboxyaminoimidazole (NCAIR) mutase
VKVAVLMGSASDAAKMAPAAETLGRFGIEADERVLSAHRTPDRGTPTTGSVVWAATAPARWAAMPAPQMKAT